MLSFSTIGMTQVWEWTELQQMPFRTSNNAMCEAKVSTDEFVYSFGGIDTTKVYSGIHNRCFKYTVATDTWIEIDSLPDPEPKIAAAASFVKGKIYIIGGYHVYQGGSEVSSELVHVYNPVTDTFEANGAIIPTPIDDHVQCVYKDSLIFVVSGWSNTGNVANVQIYDPTLDQWQAGTNTINNAFFKAFGASGTIIGDTIYYHGGAAGGSFAARKYMRKGYINPLDPTDITWEQMADAPGEAGYRSACSSSGNTLFWVGGSPISYNYNGIAYNGSGGVDPSARVLTFNVASYDYYDNISEPFGVMDLRGIAKLDNNRWIVCGGMDTNQVVSNRTLLLFGPIALGIEENVYDNLIVKDLGDRIIIEANEVMSPRLMNLEGRQLKSFDSNTSFEIIREDYPDGQYLFIFGSSTLRIRI